MAESEVNKAESVSKTQWDDMPKDKLINQVQKQLILLKKVKLKCDDLTHANAALEANLKSQNDLKTHLTTLQSENSSLKSEFTKLEQDNFNQNTKIKSLSEQLECVLMKEETANATFNCLQSEIHTLQDQNQNLIREIEVLNTARDDALTLLKSREQELKFSFEQELSEMKLKVDLLTKSQLELQTLNVEREDQLKRFNELLNLNSELEKRVIYLESELKQSADLLRIQSNDHDSKLKEYEKLTLDSELLQTQITEYQTRMSDIDSVADDLSSSIGVSINNSDTVNKLKACLAVYASSRSNSTEEDDVVRNMANKIADLENANYQFDEKIRQSINNFEILQMKVDSVDRKTAVQSSSVSIQTDSYVEEQVEDVDANRTVKVETAESQVQVTLEQINDGIDVDTQTVQTLTADSFTEMSSTELKDDLQVQIVRKTLEDGSSQTELTEEVNERVEAAKESAALVFKADSAEIERKLKEANELVGKYKTVAVKAKREVAELKKKISDLSSELQMMTNDRNSCQTRLESVTVQLATVTKDRLATENSNKSLQSQLASEKEKLKNTNLKLDQALKEANKSNLISLEIADYEKLVGELNKQIENKDLERNKLVFEIDAQKQATKALEIEIKELEMQNKQSEERAEQLKSFTGKLKEDISSLRNEEREWKTKESFKIAQQEAASQEIESYKIQLSELVNENGNIRESNRVLQEAYQKVLRSSESRVASLTKELQTVKEEFSSCQSEYENYKIRVHSVFKQQKKNAVTGADENVKSEEALEEKSRLGKMTEMLQTRVHELVAQLNVTNSELESLQEEHQTFLQRHNKLLANFTEQESSWKQRFEVLQKEMQSRQQELLQVKQTEKQQQMTLSISMKQQMEALEKTHLQKVEDLQTKLDLAQDEISRLQREMIESRSSATSTVREEDAPIDVINTERQEGEGSESTDTVFGASYKMGSANFSANSSFLPLDQLLNQDEKASVHSNTSVEIEKLENQLSVGIKKIDHLTEILNESEAANARLTEQTRVLKEEIRRLERNQEREQHLANLEYTKNVVMKFLSLPKCDERERLVPVLAKLLQLSPDEERQVLNVASSLLETNPAGASGWSSYLPKWPGAY
ncbi:GRIP and coiled-coil domain-containing protein 2 [Chamberlinius hualienensis]